MKLLALIDQIQGVGFHLDITLKQIQDAYMSIFKEGEVEITIEQWVLLNKIYESGGEMAQRDLVAINFRNKATTSRVLAGMERKGWISKKRFKGDAKQFNLVLSVSGEELIKTLLPAAQKLRRRALNDIEETDFTAFLSVLEQIRKNYATV